MDKAIRDETSQSVDAVTRGDTDPREPEPVALTPGSADAVAVEAEAVGGNILPLLAGRWAPRTGSRRRRRLRGRPLRILAVAFLALLAGWAIVPRLFASGSPTAVNPIAALLGPSGQFPLGTDQY